MEGRKGWRLWCERDDVVTGGEEKKGEAQRGGQGQGQEADVEKTEGIVHSKVEESAQQGLGDTAMGADTAV